MLVGASVETAHELIRKAAARMPSEEVSILEANGRVSSFERHATSDLPASIQSAVDGFAVPESNNPAGFRVVGDLRLGDDPDIPLITGQTVRVRTGGNLPPGTIAVIPHEKTRIDNQVLTALEVIKPGNNIKQAGEDYTQGETIINRDDIITAGTIGLLAAYGVQTIDVYRQPRVAIICLSDNVVSWQESPRAGQTRDCNIPMLSVLVAQNGGRLASTILAGSQTRPIKEITLDLLEQADILILIGGTYSDSRNDARLLMEELDAEMLYWDIPIQPGSHTGAASLGSKLLFALSGNPAACMVGYQLFVVPAIKSMQGLDPEPVYITAQCLNGFAKKSGSRRFIRGQVNWDQNGWEVSVLPGQKPSMLRSLPECNCFIDLKAGSPPIIPGQEVSVLVLNSDSQGYNLGLAGSVQSRQPIVSSL